MRQRISLLVAATTSAVILAFLIPLGLLVRTLAEDRAVAGASQEAQGVATLVAGVRDVRDLTDLVALVDARSPRATSMGSQATRSSCARPICARARTTRTGARSG